MGMKARKRTWVVWLENLCDPRDDEPLRVKARNIMEAEQAAWEVIRHRGRFALGSVHTLQEFYRWYPEWKGLV